MRERVKEICQQRRRDQMKDFRERFHRRRQAFEASDGPGSDAHYLYASLVSFWAFDIRHPLKELAEDDETIAAMLYQREFGEYAGLDEVAELATDRDSPPPAGDALTEAGEVLEEICVQYFDLPEKPPVLDVEGEPA